MNPTRKHESPKSLTIHGDLIVKQGSLSQKTGYLVGSWKKAHFLFDGWCLYKVQSIITNSTSSTPSPQSDIYSFNILDKYALVSSSPSNSDIVSHSTQQPALVTKVVDAKLLIGRENMIGLFFSESSKRPPLFLMASDSSEHLEWLEILKAATEKNSSQKNQNNSHNNIHSAVEAMVDIALISNAFGDIQCVNKPLLQFFGYSRSQMLKMNVKALMPLEYSRKHDGYLDRYRKGGDKKLIGVPRALPVILNGGKQTMVTVSLGEIPESTNSDQNRFLAVMQPILESKKILVKKQALGELHAAIDKSNRITTDVLSNLETMLQTRIDDIFQPLEEGVTKLQSQIETYEKSNARLIALTSQQTQAIRFLDTESRAIYSGVVSRNSNPSNAHYTTLIKKITSTRDQLTDRQRTMIKILENAQVDLDSIMSIEICQRYFLLYANQEQATDNIKFYLYITKNYNTETRPEALALKRDFIRETFIQSGAQYELNLPFSTRNAIDSCFKELALGGTSSEIDLLSAERSCFDTALMDCKSVMMDTFRRFMSHSSYNDMKADIYYELSLLLV